MNESVVVKFPLKKRVLIAVNFIVVPYKHVTRLLKYHVILTFVVVVVAHHHEFMHAFSLTGETVTSNFGFWQSCNTSADLEIRPWPIV